MRSCVHLNEHTLRATVLYFTVRGRSPNVPSMTDHIRLASAGFSFASGVDVRMLNGMKRSRLTYLAVRE